jgi:hypothetical protein
MKRLIILIILLVACSALVAQEVKTFSLVDTAISFTANTSIDTIKEHIEHIEKEIQYVCSVLINLKYTDKAHKVLSNYLFLLMDTEIYLCKLIAVIEHNKICTE